MNSGAVDRGAGCDFLLVVAVRLWWWLVGFVIFLGFWGAVVQSVGLAQYFLVQSVARFLVALDIQV